MKIFFDECLLNFSQIIPIRILQKRYRDARQNSYENDVKRNKLKADANKLVAGVNELANNDPNIGTIDAYEFNNKIPSKCFRPEEVQQKIKPCDQAAFKIQDKKSR